MKKATAAALRGEITALEECGWAAERSLAKFRADTEVRTALANHAVTCSLCLRLSWSVVLLAHFTR